MNTSWQRDDEPQEPRPSRLRLTLRGEMVLAALFVLVVLAALALAGLVEVGPR